MKTNANQLIEILSQHPRISIAELCRLLGNIQRSTLMRLLPQVNEQVVRLGSTRRSRYSLRRALRGDRTPIPLYGIDPNGSGEYMADLSLTHPAGSALTTHTHVPWPLDVDMQDGWFDGLPYFLSDMAPTVLGRNFAYTYGRELSLDENPANWSDDDIVSVLSTWLRTRLETLSWEIRPMVVILKRAETRNSTSLQKPGWNRNIRPWLTELCRMKSPAHRSPASFPNLQRPAGVTMCLFRLS
ncbi:MAG: hypothetical protein KF908_13940 [Nitrosomonas sp.]|nr:hypothetical protein [Nitrosomonas sp.]MCW5609012.1 hypothetical protein [Nitrosomonas sp.]